MKLLVFVILFVAVTALPKQYNKEESCGYANCPTSDPNVLNVHIVPHSHDDVGWLKTVDQYYYGTKTNIQHAGVQFILDSVIQALLINPDRRFIYVETAFFWKWWQDQNEDVRDQVRHLVNNGQLEIIGGAWSMNDEAASHYHSTIDQFTWGFRKLNETLGTCARPKIGWQIDPFGHSREQASLFSQFGFDGLFFARLDWRDKNQRLETKTAEMLWQGSQNLGTKSQLFTSILYNHYMGPPGFCFDVLCSDAPIVDNKISPEYNAEDKANIFLDYVERQSKFYRSNNVIISMGGDFHYQDALSYFANMDRLIHAIKGLNTNTRVFYSSPSCYLKAVHQANLEWPVKTDDFFPYASDPNSYWTGYFTSRPTSKRFERLGNNFLQISKQLAVLAGLEGSVDGLDPLREAIGVMQHHDAITGTEKQHVADDYARIVTEAIEASGTVAADALNKLNQNSKLNFQSCLLSNISQCDLTEKNDNYFITIYNPLSRVNSQYIRVPVTKEGFTVSTEGQHITSQTVPIFDRITQIPGRKSQAKFELVFQAQNLPPLGYKVYAVQFDPNQIKVTEKVTKTNKVNVQFDVNGNLVCVGFSDYNITIAQTFLYYIGATGSNIGSESRSSGAYIFRPKFQEAVAVSNNVNVTEIHGPLVSEYHQIFNDWIAQIVRVYADEDFIEMKWIVGPIPIGDNIGKEVISRFSTNLTTNGVFYTDSNGREMLKRIRNYRESYNLTQEEPVSQNYYPVTSKISMKDVENDLVISVLNDRAQGGASLNDGQLELMVHRRLLRDDDFGVGEALNEIAFGTGLIATGTHYLSVGRTSAGQLGKERLLAQSILLGPWTFISTDVPILKTQTWEFSGLKRPLPDNIQILTLEPWDKDTVLLRLEHILEKEEDSTLSKPITIHLVDLFTTFKILEVQEMALGANQMASEVNRLKWIPETKTSEHYKKDDYMKQKENWDVTLGPMEIKTFIVKVQQV